MLHYYGLLWYSSIRVALCLHWIADNCCFHFWFCFKTHLIIVNCRNSLLLVNYQNFIFFSVIFRCFIAKTKVETTIIWIAHSLPKFFKFPLILSFGSYDSILFEDISRSLHIRSYDPTCRNKSFVLISNIIFFFFNFLTFKHSLLQPCVFLSNDGQRNYIFIKFIFKCNN